MTTEYVNFFDLQKSPQFQIKSSYDLLITILDKSGGTYTTTVCGG